jgi:hypothetical protein
LVPRLGRWKLRPPRGTVGRAGGPAAACRSAANQNGHVGLGATAPPARAPIGAEAIALLARLQEEGRLLDFLEDDVKPYSDAEVGSAARVIHEGCRRALREVLPIVPLRDEAEGASMELPADFDKEVYKLTGNVSGSAPYRGILRHRGWRVTAVKLGVRATSSKNESHALIVAPAEVEL